MTDLSPAAQAVLDAYYKGLEATSSDCASEEDALAAALRAAALYCKRDSAILLSLADQLEGAQ